MVDMFTPQDIRQAAEKAHPVFVEYNWKWGNPYQKVVPSIYRLEETMTRLYKHAVEDGGTISSGRIEVSKDSIRIHSGREYNKILIGKCDCEYV